MSRRGVPRVLLLACAVAIAVMWFRSAPRDVTLVYALGEAGVRSLDVDIRRAGEVVRHAEFRAPPPEVRHDVRLPDGDYVVHLRVARAGAAREVEREVQVTESGTIVLPVGP